MNIEERLKFCKICSNRKVDLKIGLICKLTNKKPNFEVSCDSFIKDEKEAERKLKLKLDAAGNVRSQHGSLDPKKNINYGVFLIVAGIIVFFISILFGIIIFVGGISFTMRGMSQKKIMKENELFNQDLENN